MRQKFFLIFPASLNALNKSLKYFQVPKNLKNISSFSKRAEQVFEIFPGALSAPKNFFNIPSFSKRAEQIFEIFLGAKNLKNISSFSKRAKQIFEIFPGALNAPKNFLKYFQLL